MNSFDDSEASMEIEDYENSGFCGVCDVSPDGDSVLEVIAAGSESSGNTNSDGFGGTSNQNSGTVSKTHRTHGGHDNTRVYHVSESRAGPPSDHITNAMMNMSLKQLQGLCRSKGLPYSGTKSILIGRLRTHFGINKSYAGRVA